MIILFIFLTIYCNYTDNVTVRTSSYILSRYKQKGYLQKYKIIVVGNSALRWSCEDLAILFSWKQSLMLKKHAKRLTNEDSCWISPTTEEKNKLGQNNNNKKNSAKNSIID